MILGKYINKITFHHIKKDCKYIKLGQARLASALKHTCMTHQKHDQMHYAKFVEISMRIKKLLKPNSPLHVLNDRDEI